LLRGGAVRLRGVWCGAGCRAVALKVVALVRGTAHAPYLGGTTQTCDEGTCKE
jgi:hypothetical protein